MALAMALFTFEDSFIKSAAQSVPIGLILIIFGFFGTLIFIGLAKHHNEKIIHPALLSRALIARSFSEIGGRLFYSLALIYNPLSTASAILMATPLVVSIGAMVFFKEKVGPRRWLAIIIGFFGVLMIIRPGLDSFSPASILAVLGTLGFAGRDLANRAAPVGLSHQQLGIYGFAILLPTGVALLLWQETPLALPFISFDVLPQLIGAIVFGVSAYYCLTIATRVGDISVVSPFRYTRLLFALIVGMVIFGERPDLLSLLGSFIIVVSGAYILLQSRRQARAL